MVLSIDRSFNPEPSATAAALDGSFNPEPSATAAALDWQVEQRRRTQEKE
jgi:hypothetical protein